MKLSAFATYADATYRLRDPFRVWRYTNCVVIGIRGTADIKDVITDIQAFKEDFKGYLAHAGVVKECAEIWPEIKWRLSTKDKVFVTGHSLGGGISTLLSWELRDFGIEPTVVTFGSLRVLNESGAEVYNAAVPNTTRVVHRWDIVPRVPKIDYWHVDKELHLDDNGKELLPDQHWLRNLWRIVKSDASGLSLENHYMTGYLRAVDNYERRYRLNN